MVTQNKKKKSITKDNWQLFSLCEPEVYIQNRYLRPEYVLTHSGILYIIRGLKQSPKKITLLLVIYDLFLKKTQNPHKKACKINAKTLIKLNCKRNL
jgi:hypothetical protein